MYRGDKFPAWKGDLFVGSLAFRHLRRVHLDERGEVVGQEQFLNDLHWRIRDVRAAPDRFWAPEPASFPINELAPLPAYFSLCCHANIAFSR